MEWLLRRVLSLWVRITVRPDDAPARIAGRTSPVCYVLERPGSTDLAALQIACAAHGLPRPSRRLEGLDLKRAWFYIDEAPRLFGRRRRSRAPEPLVALIAKLREHPELDVDLVPVAVYWGRAPHRQASWLRLMFSEDWGLTTRLRKALTVLLNGRATMVELGEPLSLRGLIDGPQAPRPLARRLARGARAQFARQRAARIGPDLSHRRTIVTQVLRTRAVRAAIVQEMKEKKLSRRQALLNARRLAEEVAANYSHRFVMAMEVLLTRLWNRLYDGVVLGHVETLREVAEGNEIVYVPCHRSHMDYLLLSYAIYRQGYAIPHIAAGINLNIPVVGRFLRKGGAFFIRRSFRGSALYTVVFMKYLATIMARGHSIEYFIEGGRSRTGRLLPAKTGMLSMTVRSYLRDPVRPIVFVPVYFGYERVVEAGTYVSELSGKPKEKESVLQLVRSLGMLREDFGRVHVNLGEPIRLATLLDEFGPGWSAREFNDDTRAAWLGPLVDELGWRIRRNINSAAAVTPVNLLAIVLLATPRQRMLHGDLVRQLELCLALLRSYPYHERVTLTTLDPEAIVDYGAKMKLIERERHELGDFVRMTDECAVLSAWYRNNVLHLFALPSLVACAFVANSVMRTEDIQRLAWRVYPYVAAELCLRYREDELDEVVTGTLEALESRGLVERMSDGAAWRRPPSSSAHSVQLSLLSQATLQTIERYYLAIALLLKAGSGEMTQRALIDRCQAMARRMTLLYGLNSPEFFDRTLFDSFVELLRERAVVRVGAGGVLEFDEVLVRVARDAEIVLSEQIRHSILQVVHT